MVRGHHGSAVPPGLNYRTVVFPALKRRAMLVMSPSGQRPILIPSPRDGGVGRALERVNKKRELNQIGLSLRLSPHSFLAERENTPFDNGGGAKLYPRRFP